MPKDVAAFHDVSIVVTLKEILVIQAGKKISSLAVDYTPGAVAISPNGTEVAIGGEVQIRGPISSHCDGVFG